MNALLAQLIIDPAVAHTRGPVLDWFDMFTQVATDIGIVLVFIGILLCVLRLLKGPHLADRALAADTIAILLVALVVLFTMRFNTLAFFDGALTISLVGFATTVAMGQYIIRGRLRKLGAHEQPASTHTPEAKP